MKINIISVTIDLDGIIALATDIAVLWQLAAALFLLIAVSSTIT